MSYLDRQIFLHLLNLPGGPPPAVKLEVITYVLETMSIWQKVKYVAKLKLLSRK